MEKLRKGETQVACGVRDVDPGDLVRLIADGARVVDVREPAEWAGELGHIGRAELVPLSTLIEAQKTWNRQSSVVLVCRSGRRSLSAAHLLVDLGFQRVMNLHGGMQAYRAAFPAG